MSIQIIALFSKTKTMLARYSRLQVLLFSFLGVLNLFGQKFDKHSLEFSFGNSSLITKSQSTAKFLNVSHFQGKYRYAFSNKLSLSFGADYDRFVWKNQRTPSNLIRVFVAPTFNISEITGLTDLTPRLGLLFDVGVGIGTLRNKDVLVSRNIFGRTVQIGPDRLWFARFGLSPQYLVTNNLSVFADFSVNLNFRQNHYLDLVKTFPPTEKVGSMFLNSSLGIRYYLGGNKKHADWVQSPKLQKEDIYRILSLESQVELLQMKLEDYDGDGIINIIDAEPNTAPGAKVDSRGVTIVEGKNSNKSSQESLSNSFSIDTTGLDALIKEKLERQVSKSNKDSDGDGFPDDIDLCPDLKGTVKGCPDSDGDEIPDILDKCPNEKGLSVYSGCLEPWQESKLGERITTETVTTERITKENYIAAKPKNEVNLDTLDLRKLGIHEIYFSSGSVELTLDNMDKLNKLVALMRDNPKMKVSVIGYADNTGNPQNNESFAKRRASESVKYMVRQGIESDRISQSFKVVPADSKNPQKLRKASFSIEK